MRTYTYVYVRICMYMYVYALKCMYMHVYARICTYMHVQKRKDIASFQMANGGERRHVMCVGARSGSNPGPLGSEPSALINCASGPAWGRRLVPGGLARATRGQTLRGGQVSMDSGSSTPINQKNPRSSETSFYGGMLIWVGL